MQHRSHTQDLCPLPDINNSSHYESCKSCLKCDLINTNTSYLSNRGRFIKVRSVIRVQVFFLHLRAEGCAEGVTEGAIGFQEAALIPAEEENSDEEEQDWD